MITEADIKELTLNEKLRVMEMLWGTMDKNPESAAIPSWHENALKETEMRRQAGLEEPVDWNTAKQKLLNR